MVPPSLADVSAHFTDIKCKYLYLISVSCNDETFAKAYTLQKVRFGAQKSIRISIHTDLHQPSALFSVQKCYYSSSQPYALFVLYVNTIFSLRQLYFLNLHKLIVNYKSSKCYAAFIFMKKV